MAKRWINLKWRWPILLILGLNTGYGQNSTLPDELYGFRLGQYRNVTLNELGSPDDSEIMEDSTVNEFYYTSADSLTYVVFQYLPQRKNEIYSIQLSGVKSDRAFYGLFLGDHEAKLNSTFGKPDTLLPQSFNDQTVTVWKYIPLNLSVLITDHKIESIRIWDNYEQELTHQPTLEELFSIIQTNDKSKIADILSPGLEVYYCSKVITWKNSFYKDLYVEKASVFDFIVNSEYGLASLVRKKELKSEINLRYVYGLGSFPVYKFPEETSIKELVLFFQQGKYKIWEIKYNCDN